MKHLIQMLEREVIYFENEAERLEELEFYASEKRNRNMANGIRHAIRKIKSEYKLEINENL